MKIYSQTVAALCRVYINLGYRGVNGIDLSVIFSGYSVEKDAA